MGPGLAQFRLAAAFGRDAQAFRHALGRLVAPPLAQPGDARQVCCVQAGEEKLEVTIGGHGEVWSGVPDDNAKMNT